MELSTLIVMNINNNYKWILLSSRECSAVTFGTKEHASEDHSTLKWQQPQGAGAGNLKELCQLPAKQGRESSVKSCSMISKSQFKEISQSEFGVPSLFCY